MSLAQHVTDRMAAMQLDCPVLHAPACGGHAEGLCASVFDHGTEPVAEGGEPDEIAAVAILSNN
jgi:hypothetical protein